MLCLVLCGTQLVYSLAACFHVVMSCVNTLLMSFLISCVFVSCFTHGWRFVCGPCTCVFVLREHITFVLVFCVPCALISIVLSPPILRACKMLMLASDHGPVCRPDPVAYQKGIPEQHALPVMNTEAVPELPPAPGPPELASKPWNSSKETLVPILKAD